MACWMAPTRTSPAKGFVRNSTAPAFMALTVIGTLPQPEMKMMGMSVRSEATRFCSSRPSRSGRLTSSIRQLGPATRGRWRNACADGKVSGCHPAESINDSRDLRTEMSSSTTNTMGVASNMAQDLDAFSGDGSFWRYHIFLLQTARASICQNSCVAMTDHPRRSVVAVVDDDPGMLQSIESLLNSADYEARLFSPATALLESDDFPDIDCLISDVAMPVMDGVELARAVQAARPALPVILVTGRPDLLHRSRLDQLGQHRVFKKPFDGQELLTAVARMLQMPRPRAP